MINKYQQIHSIAFRALGFAQAVRDLQMLQQAYPDRHIQMPYEKIIACLIEYAVEYEMTRELPNEHTN
jgi:hypothetical protein